MRKSFFVLPGLVAASLAGVFNVKLLPSDVESARRISRCTEEAARTLFAPSNDISVILPDPHRRPDWVGKCLMSGSFANRTVKIFSQFPTEPEGKFRPLARQSSFVLIDDRANLKSRLTKNSDIGRWREYIIVTEATSQWLSKFAVHLWNLGFVKVAFVRVTTNGTSSLLRLVRDVSSRVSPPTLVVYDLCAERSTSTAEREKNQRDFSRPRVVPSFSSLFQTPINATVKYSRILEGTESEKEFFRNRSSGKIVSLGGDIIDVFANKHNIEPIRHHWMNQNESIWKDGMYRCFAGEVDFFFDRLPPSRSFKLGLVDAVAWYKFETLVFADSLKSSHVSFEGLMVPFKIKLWICTFALLGAFGVFAYAVDVLSLRGLIRERLTVLAIWSVFVQQPLPRLPGKFGLRFVLGMWLLHNLSTSTLYTATFSSALTATDSSNRLRTFQDILDSGRPICAGARAKELFHDTSDSQMLALYDRTEEVIPVNAFNKVVKKGYICARHLAYIAEHNWLNRRNDSLRLYSLAEAVVLKYPSFYFAKKDHPYSKELNRVVSIVRDAGLPGYLNTRYTRKVPKTKDEMALSSTDEFLKLKHLSVIFEILAIGHFVAIIVFIFELYMHRRSNRQK